MCNCKSGKAVVIWPGRSRLSVFVCYECLEIYPVDPKAWKNVILDMKNKPRKVVPMAPSAGSKLRAEGYE
jgi:hypothetical protein